MKVRGPLENLGIVTGLILLNAEEIWYDGVKWIYLTQERVQWQVSVNVITNIWAP